MMPVDDGIAPVDHETKLISDVQIKGNDRIVIAVVSTFNEVDLDGDVILPGAIKNGATAKMSKRNHDVLTRGKPPAGLGTVTVDHQRATFTGTFFDTKRGVKAHSDVKSGAVNQWSIGYDRNVRTAPMTAAWRAKGARRLIAGMELREVSPVVFPANPSTFTVSVKHQAEHDETATLRRIEADAIARQAMIDRVDETIRARRGVPLLVAYPHLEPALKYAKDVLRLAESDLPALYATAASNLPNADGLFDPKAFTIHLAFGLNDEDAVSTLYHELGHAHDVKWCLPPSEASAEATEVTLTKGWREIRAMSADYARDSELRQIARSLSVTY